MRLSPGQGRLGSRCEAIPWSREVRFTGVRLTPGQGRLGT